MAVLKDADHRILRYACCWEDADLLLEGLGSLSGASVLSIGSGGDNTFSLLSQNPRSVVCLDINATQLAVIRLKKAAFETLKHPAFLEFLGFRKGEPLKHWPVVKKALSSDDRKFWEARMDWISGRLIYQGKFEKYLLLFQRKLLPLMQSQKKTEELFTEKSEAEQSSFYHNTWNNWRWKLFTRVFFSRTLMGRMGRDPEFLKQVKGNVGNIIKKRINNHLQSKACQENYFLKFMLLESFDNQLPHYARPENFESVRNNIHKLRFFQGPIEALPEGEKFTHANLSNIFEYQTLEEFRNNGRDLQKRMMPGGVLAYWNLMVNRVLSEACPKDFEKIPTDSMAKTDFGFFYQSFNLNRKR